MAEADEMIRSYGFVLPPFAFWAPKEFEYYKDRAQNIIDARCGWDITDYGAGRYDLLGLFTPTQWPAGRPTTEWRYVLR